MNIEQMKTFVAERIKLIDDKGIKENLSNQNGLLIHVIPENLVKQNLIDRSNESHKKIINEAFRRLSKVNTIYEDLESGIFGYSPNEKYFMCFQNGIIETYQPPIIKRNFRNKSDCIRIDDTFFKIADTLNATQNIHQEIFKSSPPYYIFITFLGVQNTYIEFLYKEYKMIKLFPTKHVTFEPFKWEDLDANIILILKNRVHSSIKSYI